MMNQTSNVNQYLDNQNLLNDLASLVDKYRGYTTFDHEEPKEDETVAPWPVDKDTIEAKHMSRDDLRIWYLPNGRRITVAFYIVKIDDFESAMRAFNLLAKGEAAYDEEGLEFVTLDTLMPDYVDATLYLRNKNRYHSAEDDYLAVAEYQSVIDEVKKLNPKYGSILQMLLDDENHSKEHVIAALGLGKSQGYDLIKKAQAFGNAVRKRDL